MGSELHGALDLASKTSERKRVSKAGKIRDLVEQGRSVLEIAHQLEISPQGVYWHLNRMGLSPKSETRSA